MNEPKISQYAYLNNYDHKKTKTAIQTISPGMRFHENFSFYVMILSTKRNITVAEFRAEDRENGGDIIEYPSIKEFLKEYSLSQDKFWIEYLDTKGNVEKYWTEPKEMDCC